MKKAIKFKPDYKLIVHSDNRVQYSSILGKRFNKKNNIIALFSRPGNSIDNAACETFFFQIKLEKPEILKQKKFLII